MFNIRKQFNDLPVGCTFQLHRTIKCAGDPDPSTWLKVSTRTARVNGNGAVFYFGKTETVWVEE